MVPELPPSISGSPLVRMRFENRKHESVQYSAGRLARGVLRRGVIAYRAGSNRLSRRGSIAYRAGV